MDSKEQEFVHAGGDRGRIVGAVDGYPDYVLFEQVNPWTGNLTRIPVRRDQLTPAPVTFLAVA